MADAFTEAARTAAAALGLAPSRPPKEFESQDEFLTFTTDRDLQEIVKRLEALRRQERETGRPIAIALHEFVGPQVSARALLHRELTREHVGARVPPSDKSGRLYERPVPRCLFGDRYSPCRCLQLALDEWDGLTVDRETVERVRVRLRVVHDRLARRRARRERVLRAIGREASKASAAEGAEQRRRQEEHLALRALTTGAAANVEQPNVIELPRRRPARTSAGIAAAISLDTDGEYMRQVSDALANRRGLSTRKGGGG